MRTYQRRLTLGELQEKLAMLRYTMDKDAKICVSGAEGGNDEYIHIYDSHRVEDIKVEWDYEFH